MELRLRVERPGPLRTILSAEIDLSLRKVRAIIDQRGVWVNQRSVWLAKHLLKRGDNLILFTDCLDLPGLPAPLPVLYEDDHLLVIDKPPFRVSVGKRSVQTWVERHRPDHPAIHVVHRLDRETSGCLVVGKTKRVIEHFNRVFREREVRKTYEAIVAGKVPWEQRVFEQRIDGRSARSTCIRKSVFGKRTLLGVQPHTGRKHQIRRHLEEAGFPVVGEKEYAFGGVAPRHLLHAARIEFPHPDSGEWISVSSPRPPDFQRFLELGGVPAKKV